MHCFSFDIETVPDVDFGRRMWGLEGLPDDEVATAMTFMRQQQTGSDFLPLHQHRVVAISVALRTGDSFRVWSLGDEESDEAELVGRFFDGIERYAPDLVSWNGSGFDLPVLHYRALRHGIQAPRYWRSATATGSTSGTTTSAASTGVTSTSWMFWRGTSTGGARAWIRPPCCWVFPASSA